MGDQVIEWISQSFYGPIESTVTKLQGERQREIQAWIPMFLEPARWNTKHEATQKSLEWEPENTPEQDYKSIWIEIFESMNPPFIEEWIFSEPEFVREKEFVT